MRFNAPSDRDEDNHGFVGGLGHQTDDETGLVYMRARYYDSATGRFVSEDSARNGANWFSYCLNNPVNRVDFDGKSSKDLIEKNLDALGGFLFDAALALLGIGVNMVFAGASMLRDGQMYDTISGALYGLGMSGLVGGAMTEILGKAMQSAGATSMLGGAYRIAAGIALMAVSQFILADSGEWSESYVERVTG